MKKVFYIKNSNDLNEALEKINNFAVVIRELIEMDYSEITVITDWISEMILAEALLGEL